MLSINFTGIMEWANNNKIVLGLLASAIIITMPEKLPVWREFPEWFWEWSRDAAKTFFNFRNSGSPIPDKIHLEQVALKAELLKKEPLKKEDCQQQQLNG